MGSKLHADRTAWGSTAGLHVALGLPSQQERPQPTLPVSPAVLGMPRVASPRSQDLRLEKGLLGGEQEWASGCTLTAAM